MASTIMWSEKYRPLTLDNMVIDVNTIDRLKNYAAKKNIPHLMFIGPSGSGKLTAALCLIRNIYGGAFRSYYDEIDAQDTVSFYENFKNTWFHLAKYERNRRGKSGNPNRQEIIHTIVRNFPKFRSFGKIGFRILIINNAHQLSINTQQALRRMMEKSTRTFRLILLSINTSNLIDPIKSRCVNTSFPVIDKKRVIQVLRYIAEQEQLKISDDAIKAILFYTNNDLTKCINLLQCCTSFNTTINGDLIYNIIEKISPNKILSQIINDIIIQNFNGVRNKSRDLFLKFGYMGREILSLLYEKILHSPVPESLKIQISQKIGEIDFRIVEGANEEIQISYFLAYLYSLHHHFIGDQ